MTFAIAIVGLGKIAHDQHIPTIEGSKAFELVAAASRSASAYDIPVFSDIDELLRCGIRIDAITMSQPPQARFMAAAKAIRAGKHVLLEKPPGATLGEVEELAMLAESAGTTLFAAWHSRYAAGVAEAREWLAKRRLIRADIVWKEDVRRWHPGQQWIWDAGGLGVFDPGINALSIVTQILPKRILVRDADFTVPANRAAPIAADLQLESTCGAPIRALFDWREKGPPIWEITVETSDGTLALAEGGAKLSINGRTRDLGPQREYPCLYAHFARLIEQRRSDVDWTPLRLVADAFMRCRQASAPAFED
jgi:D-galactose 1-dehydrogenase